MRRFNLAYIEGAFVPVQGTETVPVINPTTETLLGEVTMASREDARLAIDAASRAQPALAASTSAERIEMLRGLESAILTRANDIRDATIEEYGGPLARAQWVSAYSSQCFRNTADVVRDYAFTRTMGTAEVMMAPAGVAALIVPWNSVAGTLCSKLASAVGAGCACVIKPSELSPLQTQVVAEALHSAGLPAGVFNILLGRGEEVGAELTTHAKVARVSFTGSTATGKSIARAGIETMKRVSLALTGKSASLILDDADLPRAIDLALGAAFMNNGQACVAGTRLLIPQARCDEAFALIAQGVARLKVGHPGDPETQVGPLASRAQFDRIQTYIRSGLEQGATLLAGGEGRPEGLAKGYFVKPTVFVDVRTDMRIAREEIFGPVLSVLTYRDEAEAIQLANDSVYGLQAYVFSSQPERARRIAVQLEAGSVLINGIVPDLLAPFGGLKQSGIGRELGLSGLEAFLEPKAIVAAA